MEQRGEGGGRGGEGGRLPGEGGGAWRDFAGGGGGGIGNIFFCWRTDRGGSSVSIVSNDEALLICVNKETTWLKDHH